MEDYQGPSQSGYFTWMTVESSGKMKPHRMKTSIERNPNYWDRVFKGDNEKDQELKN
jgi:hypothetical protein